MKKFLTGLLEAVQRPFAPVPCGMFRVALYPQWRTTSRTAIESSAYADHTFTCLPSLLLPAPAPGVASFCVTARSPDFGRLRHLATRLVCSSASNEGRSATARKYTDARYSDQLDTMRRLAGLGSKACLQCEDTYELYCFPPDRGSPDGRFHYCWACKAEVVRKNNGPRGASVVAPADRSQQCCGCGVLRPLAWYSMVNAKKSEWKSICKLCEMLGTRQRKERYQEELESQDPVTEKWCGGCVKMLPAATFAKDACKRDGYCARFRVCKSTASAARNLKRLERRRNQTLVVAHGTERICSKCRIRKPWADFSRFVHATFGIVTVCKQCKGIFYLSRLKAKADS